MGTFIDLTGKRFGRLIVIERVENKCGSSIRWLCRCDCGNTKIIQGGSLKRNKTKSCGCLYKTHGQSYTRLYRCWGGMVQRCTNYNDIETYHLYGGRGITVCDEWREFVNFKCWALANGYKEHLTLDRIDNDGNYEPSNCRWATMKEQNNNTRRNVHIKCPDGRVLTRMQLAEEIGIDYHVIKGRHITNPNISYERLIRPVGKQQKSRINNPKST